MAEEIAVKATMNVTAEADKGQVAYRIEVAGETLVSVRLSPEQAVMLSGELLSAATLAVANSVATSDREGER